MGMDGPIGRENADPSTSQRLAIISTPRSGNTWLRFLLATTYKLKGMGEEQIAVHHPEDVDWSNLPGRCVLQIHWMPTDSFRKRLDDNGFQPIVVARHPLDVLLSILQFAPRDGKTAAWLEGAGGDELAIHGALPSSKAFLDYACGPRASALLDVSRAWWEVPGVRRVRYEDLVRETVPRLRELLDGLAPYGPGALRDAVEANAIQNLRAEHASQMHHFWQGRPGLWRHLIPPETVRAIRQAQAPVFDTIGHDSEPDDALTPDAADARWYRIELDSSRGQFEATRKTQIEARAEADALRGELAALRDLRQQLQSQLDAAREGWDADRRAFSSICDAMNGERAGWTVTRDDLWNRLTYALERLAEVERRRDEAHARIQALETEAVDAAGQRDACENRALEIERERDEWRVRFEAGQQSVTEAARRVAAADQELARLAARAAHDGDLIARTQREIRPYRLVDPLRMVNRLHESLARLKYSLGQARRASDSGALAPHRGPHGRPAHQESAPRCE